MEPVYFYDPFAAEDPASVAPPPESSPHSTPATESIQLSGVGYSSDREREVQQVIQDLNTLAHGKPRQLDSPGSSQVSPA